ncbi:MAG TPA: methyltransferase [Bacteroidales bacterium]|nr:methyltransferase [Bacteroidales bacterium]
MANRYFKFKQFTVRQEKAAFRVTTDSVLLGAWADFKGDKRIIDIGTGTGLLALMAAQRCEANITALEPDMLSFEEAQTNVGNSPWPSRISLVNCTVQNFVPEEGILFDTVITNPPFFKGSLLNPDIRKAKARHDFSLQPEEVLMAADRLLTREGKLQLVLPLTEGMLFLKRAESFGFFCRRILRVKSNPAAAVRRVLMTLERGRTGTPEDSIIVIENGVRHDYSDEYIALTKEFYLKM